MPYLPYLHFDRLSTHLQIFTSTSYVQSFMKVRRYRGAGGAVDSIFESDDSIPLKWTQLPAVRSDFHETWQGASTGKYL